jgi:hypothetical protein
MERPDRNAHVLVVAGGDPPMTGESHMFPRFQVFTRKHGVTPDPGDADPASMLRDAASGGSSA